MGRTGQIRDAQMYSTSFSVAEITCKLILFFFTKPYMKDT